MNKVLAGVVAAVSVTAAQAVGGLRAPTPSHPRTMAWYARLRKPGFTPPGPVFGAAWTALDALQGYAGYRLMTARPGPARTAALGFWMTNLLGVAGFSWVMFGRKRLDEATGVSVGLAASAAATVATASRVDARAAWSLAPLVGWVVFASILQEEVWRRNS